MQFHDNAGLKTTSHKQAYQSSNTCTCMSAYLWFFLAFSVARQN